MSPQGRLGIVVAGGPAPGINSVIGAATIRACLSQCEVLGIQEGFRWLREGDTSHVVPLTIAETSRIHFRGGSHIGLSRSDPITDEKHLTIVRDALARLGIDKLVSIGGDGTAYAAHCLANSANGALRVVHVPKTIDNDIDLPQDAPTFGFQTARHIGAEIVKNLMVDAKTTGRWYFVVAMGGKAAGATLSLIGEEFSRDGHALERIADTLAGSVVKRMTEGRSDGVALLAEGLVDRLTNEEIAPFCEAERDVFGELHIAAINVGEIIRAATVRRLAQLGIRATIVPKTIGYEVRCADPIPFDMEYARDLGYCAARYILEGGSHAMVSMVNGRFRPIPFRSVLDVQTGKTRVRMVDTESDRYKIARSYMLRLKRSDFESRADLERLAQVAHCSVERFVEQFARLVESEPEPMTFSHSILPEHG
jgi:6-phosphofructokinase